LAYFTHFASALLRSGLALFAFELSKKGVAFGGLAGKLIGKSQPRTFMKKILGFITAALFAVSVIAGEYPDLSIKELKKAISEKKATVIDVNGTESYQKGHIPSAIDFEANEEKLAKLLPQDKSALIVAYCGGPKCMAYKQAAKAAEKLGYKNIKHLSAGISGWKDAGEKTEKGS
jgi:rhodanese-related sulfurtransferase